MKKLSRIAVGDDLSREDKSEPSPVLNLVADLAGALGSEIHLIHAYKLPEISITNEALALIELPYVQAMERALESEADSVRRERSGLRVVPCIEEGAAVEVLLADVRRHRCRMIALGTHGRKGVRRALLGSVAEEVIRRAAVPVLTLNPRARVKRGYRPKTILVAVGRSQADVGAVRQACDLALAFGARIRLVHVLEEWVYPIVQSASLLAGGVLMPLERDLKELGNQYYAQLEELAKPLRAGGVEVKPHVIERAAGVGSAIVEDASLSGANLIVMGHRRASRLEYAVLGSVSRHVVREAGCPVVTVPQVHRNNASRLASVRQAG